MTDTKTRKAVVTTAQVQEALNSYTATQATISGVDDQVQEFDKGMRGKGFATYDASGNVVKTWDTKEDALSFYAGWVKVATEVLSLQQTRSPEGKPAPKEVAAKVVEGSHEGDK